MKKILVWLLILAAMVQLAGCCQESKETVVIYISSEEYRVEAFKTQLEEHFPDYNIQMEYMPSGTHATKLLAEGEQTNCDISFEMEYGNAEKLLHLYADLSHYDTSRFAEDAVSPSGKLLPVIRNGGCIAINTKVLEEKGLDKPTCYEDLLDPKYQGLISMADPSTSGTGYTFLKSLVNAWGEEEAFAYFKSLKNNIKQFTSSGSGPVNQLVMGEAAIGLALTSQAVLEINNGVDLEILFFEEGSPYTIYGMAMIEGKQDRACVREVFDYLNDTLVEIDKQTFFPEKIYKDKDFYVENYPENIPYSDMSNNTGAEKERLLEKWKNEI